MGIRVSVILQEKGSQLNRCPIKMKSLLVVLLLIGCAYAFPIEEFDEEDDCLALFSPEVCMSLEPIDVSAYGIGDDLVDKIVDKLYDNRIIRWILKKIPSDNVRNLIKEFMVKNRAKVEEALKKGGLKLFGLLKDLALKALSKIG